MRVRIGTWNPDANEQDREQRNAMARRADTGRHHSSSRRKSIGKVLKGNNPGTVADEDHRAWYREMFAPSVTVGLLRPSDLAGYRNGQVFIRQSMDMCRWNRDAVRDAMPAACSISCAKKSTQRCVLCLGHFVFVFIHPYMDGNGRYGTLPDERHDGVGRLPVDGHTVLSERNTYMAALERASVEEDIGPFAKFLAGLAVRKGLAGDPLPPVPKV